MTDRDIAPPAHPWDGFLVGEENALAHSGVIALARGDDPGLSPLVVHGPSGVGKSRLMAGLVAETIARHPGAVVAHLAAEEFAAMCAEAASRRAGFSDLRERFRGLDLFVLDNDPRSAVPVAQSYYDQAHRVRKSGKIEEAIRLYGAAYEADPTFLAAYNEVGVLLMQTGNLRDALKVYLNVVERPDAGEQKFIAANNAADVFLTWFDAGRTKERNIERAMYFARMAMEHPTPMRACNLLLAYVKDRYYKEAQQLMDSILQAELASCPGDRFLQTLFQIRDADLVAWLNWLDEELKQASPKENG